MSPLNRNAHGTLTSKNRQLASMDAMYYEGIWMANSGGGGRRGGGRCSFENSFAGLLFSQNAKVKIHNLCHLRFLQPRLSSDVLSPESNPDSILTFMRAQRFNNRTIVYKCNERCAER